jgi:hypothetical protein
LLGGDLVAAGAEDRGLGVVVLQEAAPSRALLGRVVWGGVSCRSEGLQAGAACAGPDGEQGLEFAEYGVEGQAGAGAFGS